MKRNKTHTVKTFEQLKEVFVKKLREEKVEWLLAETGDD